MDEGIKSHIMNVLKTGAGHNHESMTNALKCPTCQMKMIRAQSEFNRLRKEYPEKFIIKQPEYPDSLEVQKKMGMLEDREKSDKLYQRHLKLLATGTTEEKKREMSLFNKGYYEKHYEEDGNIKKVW